MASDTTSIKGKSAAEIAAETVAAWDEWNKEMTPEDWVAIGRRGKINRKAIMERLGCGRPALTQNPKLKARIEAKEAELRASGYYEELVSPISDNASVDDSIEFKQSASRQRNQGDHLSHLEHENQSLKAENRYLKEQLARYEELSDSLYELGHLVR